MENAKKETRSHEQRLKSQWLSQDLLEIYTDFYTIIRQLYYINYMVFYIEN
jgi:hypothetical protein